MKFKALIFFVLNHILVTELSYSQKNLFSDIWEKAVSTLSKNSISYCIAHSLLLDANIAHNRNYLLILVLLFIPMQICAVCFLRHP